MHISEPLYLVFEDGTSWMIKDGIELTNYDDPGAIPTMSIEFEVGVMLFEHIVRFRSGHNGEFPQVAEILKVEDGTRFVPSYADRGIMVGIDALSEGDRSWRTTRVVFPQMRVYSFLQSFSKTHILHEEENEDEVKLGRFDILDIR